jgi:hypothetical protein
MLLIYIVSVLMAYFIAIGMWDVYGNEIMKWENKLHKYIIYILLSSIFIWPISFLILLIWIVVMEALRFVISIYEMIEDIFNL